MKIVIHVETTDNAGACLCNGALVHILCGQIYYFIIDEAKLVSAVYEDINMRSRIWELIV